MRRCLEWGAAYTAWELEQCTRRRGHSGPHRNRRTEWDAEREKAYIETKQADLAAGWQEIEDMIDRGELTREEVERRFKEFVEMLSRVMAR